MPFHSVLCEREGTFMLSGTKRYSRLLHFLFPNQGTATKKTWLFLLENEHLKINSWVPDVLISTGISLPQILSVHRWWSWCVYNQVYIHTYLFPKLFVCKNVKNHECLLISLISIQHHRVILVFPFSLFVSHTILIYLSILIYT